MTQSARDLLRLRISAQPVLLENSWLGACERWIPNQGDIRRVRRIQAITIVWMSVEALVSLFSAWRAPESCAARLRWGQWHRAFLGGSSAVEISARAAYGTRESRRLVSQGLYCSHWLLLWQSLRSRVSIGRIRRDNDGERRPNPTLLSRWKSLSAHEISAVLFLWLGKGRCFFRKLIV